MNLGNPVIWKAGSVLWINFLALLSLNISVAWPLLEVFENKFNIYYQLYLACLILAHGINGFLRSLPALFLGCLWLLLYYNILWKILPCVLHTLPARLYVQAGPLSQQDTSSCFQSIYVECPATQIAYLCLLDSCLLVVLSHFGCPLMHFNMQNQLLVFLVLFLVAARCLVGQFDSVEWEKGKAFMQGSFISLNVWGSNSAILGTDNGWVVQKSWFYFYGSLGACTDAVRLRNGTDNCDVDWPEFPCGIK